MIDEPPVPGARLLGWPAWLAAATIAFNVWFLRQYFPGTVSGKLSDLGINFFLPVLIAAGFEWLGWVAAVVRRRPFHGLGRTGVTVACGLSAFYFTLLKSLPAFEQVHVGWLEFLARFFPVDTDFGNVTDPTDLLTLVTTVLAYRYLAQPSGTQTPRSQRASAGQ